VAVLHTLVAMRMNTTPRLEPKLAVRVVGLSIRNMDKATYELIFKLATVSLVAFVFLLFMITEKN
jgi:hypothetical protein